MDAECGDRQTHEGRTSRKPRYSLQCRQLRSILLARATRWFHRKVEDGKVVAFPQLPEFAAVTLKIVRYRIDRDQLVITAVERVA